MEANFIDKLVPGYLDVLPDMYQATQLCTELTQTFNLQSDIYQFLNDKIGTSSDERSTGYYHPSEIATKFYCPYAAVSSRLKKHAIYYKEPVTTLVLDIGTYLHKMVQKYLKDIYGDACQIEVPLCFEPLHIAGSCDAIVTIDGVKHAIEIKTKANTRGMASAVPEHIMQSTAYEFMSNSCFGTVLYVDKSTNMIHGFTHPFDLKAWDTFAEKILVLEATLQNNRLPTPVPHRYCPECHTRDECPAYREKHVVRMGDDVDE